MNCSEAQELMGLLINGELSGERARDVRNHFASCDACAAGLTPLQWAEVLPAMDDRLEPSADFVLRFREKLEARREPWWKKLIAWGWPRQVAAAGALATLVLAGIFVIRYPRAPQDPAAYVGDIAVMEKLPFLEDMAVVSNLDLLEDFDTIENLPRLIKEADKN